MWRSWKAEARVGAGVSGRTFLPLSEIAKDGIVADGTYASPHRTYSYGAHAAHVAVDPATGHVEVLDYVAVEDVGRIINPAMLHGQAIGAIVQGLGGVFLEHLVYDEHGQLLTGSHGRTTGIAGRPASVVGERTGEQLPVLVIDQVLEKYAAEALHDGANRLAMQHCRVNDASDILDRHIVEHLDVAGAGSTATWAAWAP